MNLKELTDEELRDVIEDGRKEMNARLESRCMDRLVKSGRLSRYRFIIHPSEYDDGQELIGFSSDKPGYIDDHVPEDIQDDYQDMLQVLHLGCECMTCTYELDGIDQEKLRAKLAALGLKEDKPAWLSTEATQDE